MTPANLIAAAGRSLEAQASVDDARDGIAALATVPSDIRLDLAARLLFKPRP